jgi:hypothetical protein
MRAGAVYFPKGNDLFANVASGPISVDGEEFVGSIDDTLFIIKSKSWDITVLATIPLVFIQIVLGSPSGHWDGQNLTLEFRWGSNADIAQFTAEIATF